MDNGIFLRVVGYIYFFCRKWKIISGGTSYQTIKQNNTKKHKNKQNTKLEWGSIWQQRWLSNRHKKWKKETIPTFALLYLLVTWASWKVFRVCFWFLKVDKNFALMLLKWNLCVLLCYYIIYVGWIRRLLEGRIPSRNPFSVNITDGEALLTPPRKKSHKCEKVGKGNIQGYTIYMKRELFNQNHGWCDVIFDLNLMLLLQGTWPMAILEVMSIKGLAWFAFITW